MGLLATSRVTTSLILSCRPRGPASNVRSTISSARSSAGLLSGSKSYRLLQTQQTPSPSQMRARLHRINLRLPKFLQHYTTPLLTAPMTHVTSFLILHELTAIVPLVALTAVFHYLDCLPTQVAQSERLTEYSDKFKRWAQRKGWRGSGDGSAIADGAGKERLIVEAATAYAITKVMMPLRVIGSVWASPWFARVALSPILRLTGRASRSK